MLLEGRRAIVTGGARGIGAGIVRSFAREGAQVSLLDVKDELGEQLAKEASKETPGAANYYHCDIMQRQQVFEVFDSAVDTMGGRLDVLVNVAGVLPAWELAEDVDDELWDLVFGVNVKGTLYTNQCACSYMQRQHYGKIINFSSMAGVIGSPGLGPYSASKGAVLAWTRTVAKEWGRYGIRVNAVNPYISSSFREEGLRKSHFEPNGSVPRQWAPNEERDQSLLLISGKAGAKGDADADLGPVLVFLASADSDFITGQMIQIDGGVLSTR